MNRNAVKNAGGEGGRKRGMDKWETLKSFVDGMYYSAEVTGTKSVQKAISKIITKIDALEAAEKEAFEKYRKKSEEK
jgi:hypothetical protein